MLIIIIPVFDDKTVLSLSFYKIFVDTKTENNTP
jgi:hypothetical protein